MIFLMALMTDAVGVCQVKVHHTQVAATCLCMDLMQTHDPKMHLTPILDIC